MIAWIESHDTAVIALLVFAGCYAIALLVFLASMLIPEHGGASGLRATTPAMLTPISVINGLLIAFLAARVWANLDRAHAFLGSEATAVRQAVLLSDSLPPDTRTAVRDALRRYVLHVERDEWPAMAEGQATLRQLPPEITTAMTSLTSLDTAKSGERIAQDRAIAAVTQVVEARRSRILLSRAGIRPIQWHVVMLLSALTMVTIAMVHAGRRLAVAANLLLFSSATAACLVLLMVNDRPFATGGVTVRPDVLREIEIDGGVATSSALAPG